MLTRAHHADSGLQPSACTSTRAWLVVLSVLLAAWCGQGCTSTVDEGGANGAAGTSGSDGYELVIVDESALAGDRDRPRPAAAPATPSEAGVEGRDDESRTPDTSLPGVVAFDRDGEFTVQIGIHDSARAAGKRVLELSKLGYPAYALAKRGDSRVRVRIGYFTTREDAERFGKIFKEDTGSDYWVDRRANEGT